MKNAAALSVEINLWLAAPAAIHRGLCPALEDQRSGALGHLVE
jgi:hypothetical protein